MPRRANPSERPSRYGHGQSAPRRPAPRRSSTRRLPGAVAAAALTAGPALCGSAAWAGDDGVVALSAGPSFEDAAPAWVQPAVGEVAEESILPAGYVAPATQYGPHGELGAGPMSARPSAGRPGPARPRMQDSAVRPAQYAPHGMAQGAPYCPPGGYGGGSTEYFAKGGLQGGPGSLWTTIAHMRPPEGSFVRLEYLRYNMADEENGPVGAPIEGVTVDDPTRRFPFGRPVADDRNDGNYSPVFDTNPDPLIFDGGAVPLLRNNDIEDFDGVRLTLSRPIKHVGRAEWNAFAFSQESFTLNPEGVPLYSDTFFPAAPSVGLTIDNDPFNTAIARFENAYALEYETEMWGTGGRVYFDHLAAPEGFGMRPLVGARYLMFNQNLYQRGLNQELSTTAHNNVFGPEIGLEAELRHKWFTLGIRPTVTAGLNLDQVRTRSENLFGPNDGTLVRTKHYADFSPVVDVAAYLRVPLGETFKLSVGYELLYLGSVARPNESTIYDSYGGLRSNVRPRRSFEDVTFNALTIGLEMLYP